MFGTFSRAILKTPGTNFADGITESADGTPDLPMTLVQHAAYASALQQLGLMIEVLDADERFPDGTFVEDAAIVTPRGAIITRPGASSRMGETAAIERALAKHYPTLGHIEAPGTVDGGDICETDSAVLIGISARTNPEGARQLAGLLGDLGFPSIILDVRGCPGLLHFKTGVSALGDGRLVMAAGLPTFPELAAFESVILEPEDSYAANCIRVNDRILVPAGYPRFEDRLAKLGYAPLPLAMSEFKKMDGGLSCLSLRF
jgi:dimethylargininase